MTWHKTMTGKADTDFMTRQRALITDRYCAMRDSLYAYIRKCTDNSAEAEDILQETFTRLLEYKAVISGFSIDRFIYRIARNLVNDWYRRHALSARAMEYFAFRRPSANSKTEEDVHLDEMLEIEHECIMSMGRRKGEIYLMYIHKGKTSAEIAEILGLSRRTVENHIFAARNIVREGFRKAL